VPRRDVASELPGEVPIKADIDCTSKGGLQNNLSEGLPVHRRRQFSSLTRQLTGQSGSFAKTCRSSAERVVYCWGVLFRPRYPLIDWPFGRSLCYVVVRLIGTWFVGGCSVLGPNPRHSAWPDRSAAIGELVRASALHRRVRKDLERLQDALPLR
jgi:hypothetical protein